MKKITAILFYFIISTVSYAQSFTDVLNGINTILETVNGNENTNSYEDESNSGQQYEYNQTQSDNTNYLSIYQQWEQRAQANYNSLTNLGYQMRNNNGQQSGGTGRSMSNSNYTRMKKALREAQREMRNIRMKAAKAGINIAQSRWETATVDY